MATEGLVDEWASERYFGQFKDANAAFDALEKRYDGVIAKIVELNKVARASEAFAKQSDSLEKLQKSEAELANLNKLLGGSFKELDAFVAHFNGTSEKAARVLVDLAKARGEVAGALKKENEAALTGIKVQVEQEKQARVSAKAIRDLNDAYQIANREHNELKKQAKAVGFELGIESEEFKKLASAANVYDRRLKEVDAALGIYGRSVGNYSSATAGLNGSIQQIARELPSLSNGFATFASAIGNNIAPAQDAVKKFREEQMKLAAEGKKTTSLFSALGSSIFSYQTLLLVAVTLFTVYGKEIGEFAKGLFKAKESTDGAAVSIKRLQEAMKDSQFTSAVEQVNELRINLNLAKQGFLDKDKVVRQYNQTIGQTTGEVKSLNEVEQFLVKNADAYVKMMLYKTAATLSLNEAAKKVIENQAQMDKLQGTADLYAGIVAGTKDADARRLNQQIVNQAQTRQRILENQSQKELDIVQKFQKKAAEIAKNSGFDFYGGTQDDKTKKPKEKKVRAPADLTNETVKAEADITAALFEQLKLRAEIQAEIQENIAKDEKRGLDEQIAAVRAYTNARLQIAGYEYTTEILITQQKLDKIAEIEKIPADKRTKEQLDLLRQREVLTLQMENIELKHTKTVNGIVENGQNEILDLEEKGAKERVKGLEQMSKDLAALYGGTGKRGSEKKAEDLENRRRLEALNAYTDAAVASAGIITDLALAASNRRIEALNAEIEMIQRRGQEEVLAYQQSTAFAIASETERTQKIAEIQATALAKQAQAEQKLKEEKYKQAQQEKAANIAEIIVKTALAVVNQLGAGDPYTAIPRAIAAGALGAAQLATAIATPIPQYEEGTGDTPHPGGLARVGEKGKPELIEEPGRPAYIVSQDMIGDFRKGTHVTPLADIVALSRAYTMSGLVQVMPQKQDASGWAELKHGLGRIEQAVKSQPGVQVNLGGLDGVTDLHRMGNSSASRLHNLRNGNRR